MVCGVWFHLGTATKGLGLRRREVEERERPGVVSSREYLVEPNLTAARQRTDRREVFFAPREQALHSPPHLGRLVRPLDVAHQVLGRLAPE